MNTPPKVLIIEDNPTVAILLKYLFDHHGFEATLCEDPDHTTDIQKIIENKVDVVILDLMLPRSSGEEVLLAIRKHPKTKNIPVLVLTAKTIEKVKLFLFEIGADDFVAKPFSPLELVARVKTLLRRFQK